MIAPGAVVGDVHAVFALAGSGDQGAIHIDPGTVEESIGLIGPHTYTRLINEIDQGEEVAAREAAAEVARSGGVGDTASAQGVEEVHIVAAEFQVLQAGAAADGVVGDSENVIGFVIRQVELEKAELFVDGLV